MLLNSGDLLVCIINCDNILDLLKCRKQHGLHLLTHQLLCLHNIIRLHRNYNMPRSCHEGNQSLSTFLLYQWVLNWNEHSALLPLPICVHIGQQMKIERWKVEVKNSSTISNRILGITKHPKGTAPPSADQKQFLVSFSTARLIADLSKETDRSKRGRKRSLKTAFGQLRVKLSLYNV